MRENLQNNRIKLIFVIWVVVILTGGIISIFLSLSKKNKAEDKISKAENDDEINIEPINEIHEEVAELLDCSLRTAADASNVIKKMVPGKITELTREDDDIGKCLAAYTETGEKYLVVLGKEYIVKEIYKNGFEGERIYFIMY